MTSQEQGMSAYDALEEFGRLFVEIRDKEIRFCDSIFKDSNSPNTEIARRWQKIREENGYEAMIEMMIPFIFDHAIMSILEAIEQGKIRFLYTSQTNGIQIDVSEEGRNNLALLYKAKDGWLSRYAKQRIVDESL